MLIAAFAMLGAMVYHFTAPPPAAGERGFSISRILDSVRREVRGNRANAEQKSTAVQEIDAAVTELRVSLRSGPIAITGEQRPNVEVELTASSNGADDAEAAQLAKQTSVKFDRAGSILFVTVDFPEAGQQWASLSLKIPSRLIVRNIEEHSGKLDITNVAGVELGLARGETNIRSVRGRVAASHRGGDLVISDVGAVKLTTRGSDVKLEQVRGDAVINTQAGDLRTSGIVGPLELESNATDVTLEALETSTGMVRVNAVAGSVSMRGLRTESRIDLRNADLDLVIDRAAPIAIYSEGGEAVEVTLPAGGSRLDAATREGRIVSTPGDALVKWGLAVAGGGEGEEQKTTGDVNGGGALITIRTRQGDITLRAPGAAAPAR
jgi:hypothetical protein